METGLQQTILNDSLAPRQDLIRADFEKLIWERGRRVIIQPALVCPCKSTSTNQLSDCKNCGGSGFIFYNPRSTRIVIKGFDAVTKFTGWSDELRGMVMISCSANEQLTYMDKITVLDAISIHDEVINMKVADDGVTVFSYTAYDIKKSDFVGLFVDKATPLLKLVEGTDYTWVGNVFKLLTNLPDDLTDIDISITLRYSYAPVFYIIELKRESMESFALEGGQNVAGAEKLQHLPLSAYARRGHYVLDRTNLAGTLLVSNNFVEPCASTNPPDDNCGCDGSGIPAQYYINQISEEAIWNEIDW